MSISDRYIYSRAEGHNPSALFTLSKDGREEASTNGSYEQRLFSALFERVLPPNARLSSHLPPAKEPFLSPISINEHAKGIPNAPHLLLDMPRIANTYNTHSIALLGKNAAVVLAKSCYLVKNIDSHTNRTVNEIGRNDHGFCCVEWLNNYTIVAGSERGSDVYVIDIQNPEVPRRRTQLQSIRFGLITRIARLTNHTFLSGHHNGTVAYNDILSGSSYKLSCRYITICSVVPSPNAKHVAIGYENGIVDIYGLTEQKEFRLIRSYSSEIRTPKRAIAWLPGSNTMFICGGGRNDPVLQVYELSSNQPRMSHKLPSGITNIAFTKDKQFIATYENYIGHLRITCTKIVPIKEVVIANANRLLDACYNPEAGLITTASSESLHVWEPLPSEEVKTKKKSLISLPQIR